MPTWRRAGRRSRSFPGGSTVSASFPASRSAGGSWPGPDLRKSTGQDGFEIAIPGQEAAAGLLGNGRNDAVRRGPYGPALLPKPAKQLGSPQIQLNSGRLEERHVTKEPHDLAPAALVTQPLKNLRHREPAGAAIVLTLEALR